MYYTHVEPSFVHVDTTCTNSANLMLKESSDTYGMCSPLWLLVCESKKQQSYHYTRSELHPVCFDSIPQCVILLSSKRRNNIPMRGNSNKRLMFSKGSTQVFELFWAQVVSFRVVLMCKIDTVEMKGPRLGAGVTHELL